MSILLIYFCLYNVISLSILFYAHLKKSMPYFIACILPLFYLKACICSAYKYSALLGVPKGNSTALHFLNPSWRNQLIYLCFYIGYLMIFVSKHIPGLCNLISVFPGIFLFFFLQFVSYCFPWKMLINKLETSKFSEKRRNIIELDGKILAKKQINSSPLHVNTWPSCVSQ